MDLLRIISLFISLGVSNVYSADSDPYPPENIITYDSVRTDPIIRNYSYKSTLIVNLVLDNIPMEAECYQIIKKFNRQECYNDIIIVDKEKCEEKHYGLSSSGEITKPNLTVAVVITLETPRLDIYVKLINRNKTKNFDVKCIFKGIKVNDTTNASLYYKITINYEKQYKAALEQVIGVRVTEVTSTSVHLTWIYDGLQPQYYEIKYKPQNMDVPFTVVSDVTTQNYNISNLHPSTDYELSVCDNACQKDLPKQIFFTTRKASGNEMETPMPQGNEATTATSPPEPNSDLATPELIVSCAIALIIIVLATICISVKYCRRKKDNENTNVLINDDSHNTFGTATYDTPEVIYADIQLQNMSHNRQVLTDATPYAQIVGVIDKNKIEPL